MRMRSYLILFAALALLSSCDKQDGGTPGGGDDGFRAKVGAWYFGGWSFPADANGYTFHISPSLVGDNARKPVWGWREDTAAIMQRQVDYAADAGLEWWGFCWYENTLVADPQMEYLNTALDLFLEAPNKDRLEFCLLSCHPVSPASWETWCRKAIALMKEPNYLKVDGRPVIVFFNSDEAIASMGGATGMAKALAQYRTAAVAAGVKEPLIGAAVQAKPANSVYRQSGFEFLTTYNNSNFGRRKAGANDYSELMEGDRTAWSISATTDLPFMPAMTAGYDMRPWATDHPTLPASDFWYTGVTARLLGSHLSEMIQWTEKHTSEVLGGNLAVIYAWNEYGEGAWLTPSVGEANLRLEYIRAAIEP